MRAQRAEQGVRADVAAEVRHRARRSPPWPRSGPPPGSCSSASARPRACRLRQGDNADEPSPGGNARVKEKTLLLRRGDHRCGGGRIEPRPAHAGSLATLLFLALRGGGRTGASSSPISPSRRQPTAASQVCAGDHGCSRRLRGNRSSPTPEPDRGRTWIKTTDGRHVLPPVLQHVDQSIPDFTRRVERPHMVPVSPDVPAPAEGPVHRLGDSDREALDAPR